MGGVRCSLELAQPRPEHTKHGGGVSRPTTDAFPRFGQVCGGFSLLYTIVA